MATIPTQEQILLQISKSLGISTGQTRNKKSFVDLKKPLKLHAEMTEELFDEIFTYLGFDEEMKLAAFHNAFDLYNFNKSVELMTWTYDAQSKHILWFWFAYICIPGLARNVAFWELAKPMDRGMPDMEFWYLPKEKNGKLISPVSQVIEWVFDLLGIPIDQLKSFFKSNKTDEYSIERNLYNWWKKGNIPFVNTIELYFSEDTKLEFKGCFTIDNNKSLEEQLSKAIKFISDKKLDAEELSAQIYMTEADINSVINNKSNSNLIEKFVNLLTRRYQKPTLQVIRQRLIIARMVQDGFKRLQKVLTPDVDLNSINHKENKILQLISIFQHIYNLTIQSTNQGFGNDTYKQNTWFESQLNIFDKSDVFMSILPSKMGKGSHKEVAETLTHKFEELNENSLLEDILLPTPEEQCSLLKHKIEFMKEEQEQIPSKGLLNKLRNSSARFKQLQKIKNFKLVRNFALRDDFSPKAKEQIITRLFSLAKTDQELIKATILELDYLLNQTNKNKNTERKVDSLINKAKKNTCYRIYKAPILTSEAKHYLFKNDFEKALKLFKDARDDCYERSFGDLRGQIARDSFAIEVANRMLIPNNHESYYRNIVFYGMIENKEDSTSYDTALYDTAISCSNYFWEDLYVPYKGYNKKKPKEKISEKKFKEVIEFILFEDWDNFSKWIKNNSKLLKDSHFYDVRGDTFLASLMNKRKRVITELPKNHDMEEQETKIIVDRYLNNLQQAIFIIAKKWKKLINKPDFKKQTPLMFAVNDGDYELLEHFLKLEGDTNLQDYRNRHPLYLAALSGNLECIQLLLKNGADPLIKASKYEHTVLFPAIASGNRRMVEALLKHCPRLIEIADIDGTTPLDVAKSFNSNDSIHMRNAMRQQKRPVGTQQDYKNIESFISERSIH